ncbi:hypothetical protein IJT10_00710 [bacterium]|nr:hypothetical protein [bacterium]
MDRENGIPSGVRLILGLMVGVLIGIAMGRGVDVIRTQVSLTTSILAIVSGLVSTYVLKLATPRCERPTMLGISALLLVLACYIAVGNKVLLNSGTSAIVAYACAGVLMALLVFTSTAESSLLWAFCIGGFLSGLLGMSVSFIFPNCFSVITNNLNPSELATFRNYLSLMCTIPGSFAAVAGRLSGWGLVGKAKEEIWVFDNDGKLRATSGTR